MVEETDTDKIKRLEARVKELETEVAERKAEVTKLQVTRRNWNRKKARRIAREMVDTPQNE